MSTKLLQPTTDILNHTNDLKNAAQNVASDFQAEACNRFGGLKDAAGSHLSDVRGCAADSWETLKGFVRQHPFAAVGIGVAAGLILAAAARNRA